MSDLRRRFEGDCRILSEESPGAALKALEALAEQHAPVALLIADHRMPEMTGVEFLVQAHALHPRAKRVLLAERDYTAANPIVPAMTLGQIDYHLVKPWTPEQGLYPPISEFLAAWAAAEEPSTDLLRVVGREHSTRSHEIRTFITNVNLPYTFYAADSEEGRCLLQEIGQDGCAYPSWCGTTGACWSSRPTPN